MYPQRTLLRRRLRSLPAATPRLGTAWPAPSPSTRSAPLSARTAIESFRSHIDALYLMALICHGERRHAEEAVVDAMVVASAEPSLAGADPSSVWRCLASHFCCPNERTVVQGSSAATVGMAGLSHVQRQAIALVAVGHDLQDVANILDIPPAQLRVEVCGGTAALDAALHSAQPNSRFPA